MNAKAAGPGIMRLSSYRRFLATVCIVGLLADFVPAAAPQEIAKKLATGTVATTTNKRTVGACLDSIGKRYRLSVQAIDKFGRKSPELRALASSVAGKKVAFWELMRKVLAQSGLKLHSINKGKHP